MVKAIIHEKITMMDQIISDAPRGVIHGFKQWPQWPVGPQQQNGVYQAPNRQRRFRASSSAQPAVSDSSDDDGYDWDDQRYAGEENWNEDAASPAPPETAPQPAP